MTIETQLSFVFLRLFLGLARAFASPVIGRTADATRVFRTRTPWLALALAFSFSFAFPFSFALVTEGGAEGPAVGG